MVAQYLINWFVNGIDPFWLVIASSSRRQFSLTINIVSRGTSLTLKRRCFVPGFNLKALQRTSAYLNSTPTKLMLIGGFLDGDREGDAVPDKARRRVLSRGRG